MCLTAQLDKKKLNVHIGTGIVTQYWWVPTAQVLVLEHLYNKGGDPDHDCERMHHLMSGLQIYGCYRQTAPASFWQLTASYRTGRMLSPSSLCGP